jgi:hypothetical protein
MRTRSVMLAFVTLAAAGVTFVAGASPAQAVDLSPPPGTYTINTTALTITPSPGAIGSPSVVDGVAVFSFGNITIGTGVTMRAVGSRPLRLAATGSVSIAGTLSGAGANATNFVDTAAAGGADGGAGGNSSHPTGAGPGGGGGQANANNGGGGGGHGGVGARGAVETTGANAAGGAAYGTPLSPLQGGSGGGSGATTSGGGGGGALDIVASAISVGSTGVVTVNGGGGAVGAGGASAGGSGGGLVLRAQTVAVQGTVSARGGPGGAGGCCADGGGGGGGRILILSAGGSTGAGTVSVAGGTSGTRSSDGCCLTGGVPSPDAMGHAGSLTKVVAGMTLTASADTSVTLGQATTLATRLAPRPGGTLPAGALVSLSKRSSPSSAWTAVTSVAVSGSGAASLLVQPDSSTEYRWSYVGDAMHFPAVSPITTVLVTNPPVTDPPPTNPPPTTPPPVAPTLKLKAADKSVPAGQRIVLFGTATPEGSGQQVRLERMKNNTWVSAGTATMKKQKLPGGKKKKVGFVFSIKARATGKVTYRVVEPAAGGLAEGVSKSLTVKVT